MEQLQSYLDYVDGTPNLLDPNYDCAEIADDLIEIFKEQAVVYKVYRGPFKQFNVVENGELVSFEHHYFVVVDDMVYDPRYNREPVSLMTYVQSVYSNNLDFDDIKIELQWDFNKYNESSEIVAKAVQSISVNPLD